MTSTLKDKLESLFLDQSNFINYEGLIVTFQSNPPIPKDSIAATTSDLKLPKEYLDFLKLYNGCILFEYQGLDGFEFLGTKNIIRENNIQSITYEEDWKDNLTSFCLLLGDGDFLSFRIYGENDYDILDCYHDDDPSNWKVIGKSFDSFLEKLIEERGKRFWL